MNIAHMIVQPKSQPKATPGGDGEGTAHGDATNGEAGSGHSFATALQNAHRSNPKGRKDPQDARSSYHPLDAQLAAQVSAMQPLPAADAPAPPISLSIPVQPASNPVDGGPGAGRTGASMSDVRDLLDAQSLQGGASASAGASKAVVSDFAMLAGLPAVPPTTAEPAPELTAATGPTQPALPSVSPSAASPLAPQPNISPAQLDASSKTRPAASPPTDTANLVAGDKRTPASSNARLDTPSPHADTSSQRSDTSPQRSDTPSQRSDTPSQRSDTPSQRSDTPSQRSDTPTSHLASYAKRTENRAGAGSSSYASAATAQDRTGKTAARTSSDAGDGETPSGPSPAAAPGPAALEAVRSLPSVSDNANGVTAVNGSSPEVKAASADPVASTDAAVSAANQAVLRRAAAGEIHVPELGRIAVRADGPPAAVNVAVSVDRPETHAVLHASAGALAADLRQADVPLGHLRFDRGNAHGAPGDSGTGSGTSSQDRSRDSHPSADHDEADDTTPVTAAGRVRIVL